MDILTKKICCDFAILNDYVSGGYIYDIYQLITFVDDVKTKTEAKEIVNELKKNNSELNYVFEKIETSKDLRYILVSNLHDAVITQFTYRNNTISINLDLSEVKTLFLKNKILDKITLNFENVADFKIPGKDLLNRTIMGLNMNINTDGRYEFSLETYDCTPSSTDIFDCVILNFKCYNLCILDED